MITDVQLIALRELLEPENAVCEDAETMMSETKIGFGRRNPYCSNCGDERGGPFGHEISECRYRSGMIAGQVAELLPEHRRGEFWDQAIERYLAAELAKLDEQDRAADTTEATDGRD